MSISFALGQNYDHSAVAFDDGSNFTRSTYENYGDYGRLNLGTIVNKGSSSYLSYFAMYIEC